MSDPIPPNRWELTVGETESGYATCFEGLIAQGTDIDGEARLVDTLAPRGARILDAGSGMGRVAGALTTRGHRMTAVEKDPDLVRRSRARYPDVPVVVTDILGLTPSLLESAGLPTAYDVVVVVGNVMVYLADDTEVRALRVLAGLLAPDGRVLVGFHPKKGPAGSRDYPVADFTAHVAAAGLAVEHLFGSYDLRPPAPDYLVAVLRPAPVAR
jgi:SAM-dependent methyltransferase